RSCLVNKRMMTTTLKNAALLGYSARTVIANLVDKQDRLSQWCRGVLERRGMNRVIVALAAKNARTIWSLLHTQTEQNLSYMDYNF
ncbi:hypothetical protein AB6E08_22430, partial [Vibrio sp. 10N.247.310.24]